MWYKVLTSDLRSPVGDFDWASYVGRPDKRTPVVDSVKICVSGYHAITDPMQWPEVGMRVFEAMVDDEPVETQGDKGAWPTMGLGRERSELVPDWWRDVEAFVAELKTIPWLQPQGEPDSVWRVFNTRIAALRKTGDKTWDITGYATWARMMGATWSVAHSVAWNAARYAARDAVLAAAGHAAEYAVWDAARDASLWAAMLVCRDLAPDQYHVDYVRACMDVWRHGYGLLGDIDGKLYVYRRLGR